MATGGQHRSGRYARQQVLAEIGAEGQARIAAAKVVIVGVGALGSNSANLLARAGVGQLTLIDRDFVDWTNLQRQCLYEEADVEATTPKAEAAAAHLGRINSDIVCEAIVEDFNAGNAERLISGADLVVDGLDNFHSRAVLNQACVKLGIPWVHGACLGTYGNAATIVPGRTACLHCLMPEVGHAASPPLSCETVGVIGSAPVIVAAWQVAEAMKILVGDLDAISTSFTHFDLWPAGVEELPAVRRPDCPTCGKRDFDLLSGPDRLASASICGRDAVQIVPAADAAPDFDLLCETLANTVEIARNDFLVRFTGTDHAGTHDIVVFRDGRAMIFGTGDTKQALALYGKYVGG
ncbi:ThiF family adenylyltransferase [Breoghania sp. JC706]|uniref:ThiF family adenylyltransferase n=1 Tax=Breoghania sp. JC706 TaxID=3117732 RepID=UPI00300B9318